MWLSRFPRSSAYLFRKIGKRTARSMAVTTGQPAPRGGKGHHPRRKVGRPCNQKTEQETSEQPAASKPAHVAAAKTPILPEGNSTTFSTTQSLKDSVMDFLLHWILPRRSSHTYNITRVANSNSNQNNHGLSPLGKKSRQESSTSAFETPKRGASLTSMGHHGASDGENVQIYGSTIGHGSDVKTSLRRSKRKRYTTDSINFSSTSPDGKHYMKRTRTERMLLGEANSPPSSSTLSTTSNMATSSSSSPRAASYSSSQWWAAMSRTDRLRRRRRQIIASQQTKSLSSEHVDNTAEHVSVSCRSVDSDQDEDDDLNDDNPLPGVKDAITLCPILVPAMSPYGHVIGLASWQTCLKATGGRCPFTKEQLSPEQLIVLTKTNIDRYLDRIIYPY